MKVIPRDFVKLMREQFDRHDTYNSLEHQLLTEIATRQMENLYCGKGKALQAVAETVPGKEIHIRTTPTTITTTGTITRAPRRTNG